MLYLLGAASAFFLTFTLTLIVIQLCYRYKILSVPRERDVHKKPIPRLGGIAIFLSFLSVALVYYLLVQPGSQLSDKSIFGINQQLLGILAGAFIIAFSMLIDDLRGLSAWQKFGFQFLSVLCIIASGIGIDHLANPFGPQLNLNSVYIAIPGTAFHFSLLSDLLTTIWLVGMMNVINFVDGIDGLASGLSVIACIAIFLLALMSGQPAVAMLAIILAGSALGFLLLNYPPAKVFMGDSGAMFLGFMLGVLPLLSGGKLATAFLVLGFPIVDGLFVAMSRLLRHKNPFTSPDNTHLHHRFINAGFSIRQSLWAIWLIAAAFSWVALRSNTLQKIEAFGVLVLVLLLIIYWLNRKKAAR